MNKRIYVHIGMPKTATSFLQHNFFSKIKGIKYLDRSNQEYNKIFESIIFFNPLTDNKEIIKNKIDKLIKNTKEKCILISDEAWFGGVVGGTHINFSNNYILSNLLKDFIPNAKIIFTIRRQDKLIESLYKHSIREGYHKSIRDFVNYKNHYFDYYKPFSLIGPNINPSVLNYMKYYNNYKQLFGENNILIIPQESINSDYNKFQQELLHFLNIKQNIVYVNTKINSGLNYYGLIICKFLNRFFIFYSRGGGFIPNGKYLKKFDNLFILGLLSKFTPFKIGRFIDKLFKSKKKILPLDLSELIMNSHKQTNKELDKQCNFDLKKYKYH